MKTMRAALTIVEIITVAVAVGAQEPRARAIDIVKQIQRADYEGKCDRARVAGCLLLVQIRKAKQSGADAIGDYSYRSAIIGSTRVARSAGT